MTSHVYVLVHATEPRLKIGKADHILSRCANLGIRDFDFERSFGLRVASSKEAFRTERALHQMMDEWRLAPEDFATEGRAAASGSTEWFDVRCLPEIEKALDLPLLRYAARVPVWANPGRAPSFAFEVASLEGVMLDGAVARALGCEVASNMADIGRAITGEMAPVMFVTTGGRLGVAGVGPGQNSEWAPSRDWRQGGPIIEKEQIMLCSPEVIDRPFWQAVMYPVSADGRKGKESSEVMAKGGSALVAAMRAFVTSRFGEEVDLPVIEPLE